MALRFIFVICFLIGCVYISPHAMAADENQDIGVNALALDPVQSGGEQAIKDDDDGNIDFDDIPDTYLLEARNVYKDCESRHVMRVNYDCKCYALRFLETRLQLGPTEAASSINFSLERECRDATESAGYEYNKCLANYYTLEPGTDPEKYCECYANKYVELLNTYAPIIQSKTLTPMKVEARVQCNKQFR